MDQLMSGMNANSIQMMGVVNALKTGNSTADAFIAMAIPYVLSTGAAKAFVSFKAWKEDFFAKEEEREEEPVDEFCYRRMIIFSTGGPNTGDRKMKNQELHRALQLFISKTSAANMDDNAIIELREEETKVQEKPRSRTGSEALKALERCEIIEKMPLSEWHDVGCYGMPAHRVRIRFDVNTHQGQAKDKDTPPPPAVTTTQVQLSSTGPKSIGIFIDQVFTWYKKMHENKTKEHRYLFDLDGKIHRLSDEKTFESLFSKPCRDLAKIVHHFHNKTGKYAIRGYPQKLGVLLHGPPGTAPIHNCFFYRRYYNEQGQDLQFGFYDIIFVLEDVDADSPVVRSRSLQPKPKKKKGRNKQPAYDELNLTGLLNVLDGVVDTPGRMVVLTTNHPEMLDPALIRPGRIDKILKLGYMNSEDISLMIEHYFETKLDNKEKVEIDRIMKLPNANFTPAVLEQLTIEHDDVTSLLQALEAKVYQKDIFEESDEDEEEEEEEEKPKGRPKRKRGGK